MSESEKDFAIRLANKVLDDTARDPDSDLSVLARQFLRASEPRWLPIDIAPLDGTKFLAHIKHGDIWFIVIASFAPSGVLYDTRVESCVGWDPCGKLGKLEGNRPRWMPLPEPPK